MANHKSALKRARQNQIKRLRNRTVKTRVKTMVKDVREAASEKSVETAGTLFKTAQETIDKAAKKGVLHKRTASRKIARLAKLTNAIAS